MPKTACLFALLLVLTAGAASAQYHASGPHTLIGPDGIGVTCSTYGYGSVSTTRCRRTYANDYGRPLVRTGLGPVIAAAKNYYQWLDPEKHLSKKELKQLRKGKLTAPVTETSEGLVIGGELGDMLIASDHVQLKDLLLAYEGHPANAIFQVVSVKLERRRQGVDHWWVREWEESLAEEAATAAD